MDVGFFLDGPDQSLAVGFPTSRSSGRRNPTVRPAASSFSLAPRLPPRHGRRLEAKELASLLLLPSTGLDRSEDLSRLRGPPFWW